MYKRVVILIVVLLGLYFIYQSNTIEAFTDVDSSHPRKMTDNCPDVLIQKGSALFLYNSKRANIPGVNPIRFENLEEYIEFTQWQRSQGILCPILYLQHAYNAQGEPVYKARPSPTNLQGGLPDYYVEQPILGDMSNTNRNFMPSPAAVPIQGYSGVNGINTKGTLFIDTASIHPASIGSDAPKNYIAFNTPNDCTDTPLDNLYKNGLSPNPMDDNWGGIDFTENLVRSGYFKGDEVSIAV